MAHFGRQLHVLSTVAPPDFDQKKKEVMFKDVRVEDRANLRLRKSYSDAAEKDI